MLFIRAVGAIHDLVDISAVRRCPFWRRHDSVPGAFQLPAHQSDQFLPIVVGSWCRCAAGMYRRRCWFLCRRARWRRCCLLLCHLHLSSVRPSLPFPVQGKRQGWPAARSGRAADAASLRWHSSRNRTVSRWSGALISSARTSEHRHAH